MRSLNKSIRNLANYLTVMRILFAFPLIIYLSKGELYIAWILFLIASITDIVDGYLARIAGGGSKWGAKADPLADKLLVFAPILWLNQQGIIPYWSVWLMLARELIVTLKRSSDKQGNPASFYGKIKTLFLFISIELLIWPINWTLFDNDNLLKIGLIMYWLALITSIYSGALYFIHQSESDLLKNRDLL